jgi:CRP/FNR family transcriptional regulator, cyclic AMP receptor protein
MTADPLAAAFPLLTADQRNKISALAETITIKKGGILLREGQHADSIYVITQGVADLMKTLAEMKGVVTEIKAGEVVGEMSFAGNFPATATVTAITDIAAMKIDKSKLMALLESDATLGMAVFRSIASTLSRRLFQMTERFAFLRLT